MKIVEYFLQNAKKNYNGIIILQTKRKTILTFNEFQTKNSVEEGP